MKENYRMLMEEAPNTNHEGRYTVIGYPQDGGKPVIKMTDDRDYAILLYRQIVAFNGHGSIHDNTGEPIRLPSFSIKYSTKKPVRQAGYYRLTGYGWLVVFADGRKVEVATDAEARELLGLL